MTDKKILIVEDEIILAMDVQGSLEQEGYKVTGIADSAEKAMAKIDQVKPDLVIMDVKIMGKVDGIETGREIINNHSIPIIFITGNVNDLTLKKIEEMRPAGLLSKPIMMDDLISLVREVLG